CRKGSVLCEAEHRHGRSSRSPWRNGWSPRGRPDHPVIRNEIKRQALEWAARNPHLCHSFIATSSWCSRFMERKGLVLQQKTRTAQTLPRDLGH
ncbi:hypothetical protein M514_23458, partial [Trichuris suis]